MFLNIQLTFSVKQFLAKPPKILLPLNLPTFNVFLWLILNIFFKFYLLTSCGVAKCKKIIVIAHCSQLNFTHAQTLVKAYVLRNMMT